MSVFPWFVASLQSQAIAFGGRVYTQAAPFAKLKSKGEYTGKSSPQPSLPISLLVYKTPNLFKQEEDYYSACKRFCLMLNRWPWLFG